MKPGSREGTSDFFFLLGGRARKKTKKNRVQYAWTMIAIRVTIVHEQHSGKFTEGAFKEGGYEVARDASLLPQLARRGAHWMHSFKDSALLQRTRQFKDVIR